MPAGCFHTQFKEIPVNTILLAKLFVSALLSDLTIINYNDLVSLLYRTQAVSYGN